MRHEESTAAKVRTARMGLPTDGPALVRRYRAALAEAFMVLPPGTRDVIAERYGLVYIEPKPEVWLSSSVPAEERIFDEHTR